MSTLYSRYFSALSDYTNGNPIDDRDLDGEFDAMVIALNRKVLCSGSAPSSPIAGQTWVDTTNKYLKWYRNGEWVIISVVHVGSSAPSTLQEGDVWYDTSNDLLKAYNGSAWLTIGPNTSAITGAFKNLKIVRNSVTQVTCTADELILKDSSNIPVIVTSFNKSAAISSSGAGGLDTGAEGSSTWYYIWAIRKSSDGTTNLLLSASSTSPTMPSGYDQKALVSAVYNDSSSDFIDFIHEGRDYFYSAWRSMASGTVTPFTSVTTTNYVPSALSTIPIVQITSTTNQNGVVSNISAPGTDGNDIGNVIRNAGNGGNMSVGPLNLITANTLWWGVSSGSLRCAGFIVNKLS
jgi:hypothetical protein